MKAHFDDIEREARLLPLKEKAARARAFSSKNWTRRSMLTPSKCGLMKRSAGMTLI
jgi:hypothetical protein